MTNELENKSMDLEKSAEIAVEDQISDENTEQNQEISDQEILSNEQNPQISEESVNLQISEPVIVSENQEVINQSPELEDRDNMNLEDIREDEDEEDNIELDDSNDQQSIIVDLTKEEILEKMRFLIHETEIEDSRRLIDSLKNQYYKIQKIEFDKLKKDLQFKAGEDVEVEMPKDPTEDYLKELLTDFRKKKYEHSQKLEEGKVQNFKLKENIIEKIKGLANSEESLNKTFAEFKALQQEWINIGPVPNSEASNLWKNYQLQIERFYDLVKINKELRDLDFKRNLEHKIELCEKSEELLLETDILAAYKKLQEYHELWKEAGPVPSDKRDEIWDRFSETSRKIRQSYQEHFEKLKTERQSNYEQKLILCQKAEEIFDQNDPQSGKEWTDLAEKILELQQIWKTIGMVPNSVNTEVYERFRAACNKFFDSKKDFFAVINEELNANLQQKIEICISAETIKDNTDWKKTTEIFLDLQKKWKTIGQIPKKNSDQVWKRFRTACDYFFNAKSEFYNNIEGEQKLNLVKKEELIEEIKQFQPTGNQADNIAKVKEFQSRWTEIGFVAASQKDRLYVEFRAAINQIFENLNLNRNSLEISNFNSKIEMIKESGGGDSLSKERNRVLQRIQELNSEIIQIENNMGFFSSGSESIVKEFQKKIDKAKEEIKLLKDKKKSIDLAERELKKNEDDTKDSE